MQIANSMNIYTSGFLTKHSEGVLLSGPILRFQAVKFHHDLHGNNNFFVSDGWLSWWQPCHGICLCSIDGEAQSCDSEFSALFLEELKNID